MNSKLSKKYAILALFHSQYKGFHALAPPNPETTVFCFTRCYIIDEMLPQKAF